MPKGNLASVEPLRARIAALLEDPGDRVLARSILCTTDVEEIASRVELYCQSRLDRRIAGCFGFLQSVGAVFLLSMQDGSRVALKAHGLEGERLGARATIEPLRAVTLVQEALAGEGVPCARIVSGPDAWPGGHLVGMEVLDAGEFRDPHSPPVRRAMASLLARIVRSAERFRETPNLPTMALPSGALWPKPHNALFDFGVPGGEWIDERAQAARRIMADSPERIVVAHTDFSGANMRFEGSPDAPRVSALYDADSFALIDEMRLLANVAVHFTYLPSEVDATWTWPSKEDARAFVADYCHARGAPLSDAEAVRLNACATYSLAYTARCEHGLDPTSEKLVGSLRERLLASPRAYLAG
jgi:hypothetical protein